MKCCICNEEVDTTVSQIPPTWYGTFRGEKMLAVIHDKCIEEPGVRDRWIKGEFYDLAKE